MEYLACGTGEKGGGGYKEGSGTYTVTPFRTKIKQKEERVKRDGACSPGLRVKLRKFSGREKGRMDGKGQ